MGCRPLDTPELTWDQFIDVFLERFVPYSLRDRMHYEFDRLELRHASIPDPDI